MLQILLAADERLQKAIVGPLEAKGCSVRVVRGLSEVAQACAQEPRPQVIAAALPVSAGGTQAIGELRASARVRLPPLLILLPPNRGSEAPALKAAGAADVFESPLKLNAFLARARELASSAPAKAKPVPHTPELALVRHESTAWPGSVMPLEDCQSAILSFNASGELPAGFEQETLLALFRVMTDAETGAVKELADGSPSPEPMLFVRLTSHRLRVRQAIAEADRLTAGGAKAPVDELALAEWIRQLISLTAEARTLHERAVAANDVNGTRQYKLCIDAFARLRRDIESTAVRIAERKPIVPTDVPDDHAEPPRDPGGEIVHVTKEKPAVQLVKPADDTQVLAVAADKTRRWKMIALVEAIAAVLAVGYLAFPFTRDVPRDAVADIPGAQSLIYENNGTQAIVSQDFNLQKWGYALEKKSRFPTQPIRVETTAGAVLGTIEGDTAHLANGTDVKLDKPH